MMDDISFLVQETFKEASQIGLKNNYFVKDQNQIDVPEDSAGILYRIQKNAATFVLRVHVSEDIRSDYKNIITHPDLYPGLRFEEEDDIQSELEFHVCDDIAFAKTIKSKLGNKRFPIHEEDIFNISDPGDSWWLRKEDDKLSIFFKLSHTQDLQELIKLGPLGDADEATELFGKLYGYFKMLCPVEDYSSAFGQFSFRVENENNAMFRQLFKLFARGDVSPMFWDYLRELEHSNRDKSYYDSLKKANYFLMELASVRRFWLEVQSQL